MKIRTTILSAAVLALAATGLAQPPAPAPAAPGRGPAGPAVVSPEVLPDRRIAFRILAPQATEVGVRGGDIPGMGQGPKMAKGENGVWEGTVGPVPPGSYRYTFVVQGVAVVDPRNPITSQSNATTWSLVHVPGEAYMDAQNVPHGAVAAVYYHSTALNRMRRMHIYTPPGYEQGGGRFPVFYLLHGSGDSDGSWSTVGRAGFILDNLIAAKKAKPMIVVMPAGHTSTAGGRGAGGRDEFGAEFVGDIMPFVEKNYRVIADRPHRAMAGLSMGGGQTLNIAIPRLDKFAYLGVYSSGLLGAFPRAGRGGAAPAAAPAGPSWQEQNKAALDNAAARKGLKLLWFATGVDDGLISTTRQSVDLLKKHGFNPVFKETPGAHTWMVWRQYLNEFAPMLFQ